jgi:hypothetical protein
LQKLSGNLSKPISICGVAVFADNKVTVL